MAAPTGKGRRPLERHGNAVGEGSRRAEADYLFGRNPVLEALRAGRVVRRVLVATAAHGPTLDLMLAEARRREVPVQLVDRARLDELTSSEHHQGVAAEVAPFKYATLEEILDRAAASDEPPLLLVLDSLQDPQNFGTLLRTAQAVGVHGVVLPEHRSVQVTPVVSKVSAGAVEHLAVARTTNLARGLRTLKERGVWIYGLTTDATQPFWSVDWNGPSALVVGAEGPGLGRLVRETCDVLVTIPMAPGAVQSLNAATAGSLVLYEAFRQRMGTPANPATGETISDV